MDQLHFDLLI